MEKELLTTIIKPLPAIIILIVLFLTGCASTSMKIEQTELEVSAQRSDITPVGLEFIFDLDVYGGMPADPFAVKGNVLFISDLSGRVYAYNLVSGERRGIINVKNSSVVSPPLVEDHTVTLAAVLKNRNSTDVIVYDFLSNTSVETYNIEDIGLHLFKVKTKVYLLCRSGYLYEAGTNTRYRLSRGVTAWYADDKIIVTAGEGGKLSIAPSEDPGRVKEFKTSDDIISAISLHKGIIYTVSDDLYLRKIDAESGNIIAERKLKTRCIAAPLLREGNVILADLAGNIIKFNDDNALTETETVNTGGLITVPPVISGGNMIILNHERRADILEVSGLKKIYSEESDARFITGGLIHDGLFIAGTNKAVVKVYRLR